MKKSIFLIAMLAAVAGVSTAAVEYPGDAPGKAVATKKGGTYSIGNDVLTASFEYKKGGVTFGGVKAADGTELVQGGGAVFSLNLADGRERDSTSMTVSKWLQASTTRLAWT